MPLEHPLPFSVGDGRLGGMGGWDLLVGWSVAMSYYVGFMVLSLFFFTVSKERINTVLVLCSRRDSSFTIFCSRYSVCYENERS